MYVASYWVLHYSASLHVYMYYIHSKVIHVHVQKKSPHMAMHVVHM